MDDSQDRDLRKNSAHGLSLEFVTVEVPDGEDVLVILDEVSLSAAPGEIVAITGASGSGKSTLMAVAGLLRTPRSGKVRIADKDTDGLSAADLTKIRLSSVGLVFQTSNLFPALTAVEQLEFVAHVAGKLDVAARDKAAELLRSIGLGHRLNSRPAHLSGGERQRVGIARALMNDPDVLLADEPTAALDETKGREIMSVLAEQAISHDVATVIVTHAPEQLIQATRRLRLDGGKLTDEARTVVS